MGGGSCQDWTPVFQLSVTRVGAIPGQGHPSQPGPHPPTVPGHVGRLLQGQAWAGPEEDRDGRVPAAVGERALDRALVSGGWAWWVAGDGGDRWLRAQGLE